MLTANDSGDRHSGHGECPVTGGTLMVVIPKAAHAPSPSFFP